MTSSRPLRGRRLSILACLVSAAALCAACSSSAGSSDNHSNAGRSISLVAYSTPATAYQHLISAFQKTSAGSGVTVSTSFGPSGQQARSVAGGLPADVVNFSTEPDMDKLVQAGLVSSNWDTVGPAHGMVTNSVVVFVVRKGNPKHITSWADLVKPGVKVLTPNPFSSGSARWNLMAAYGAQLQLGATPAEAQAYVGKLLNNTVSQPASASDAMAAFTQGTGDVLLDYEDDAIAAQRKGEQVQYIVPPQTILIQNPIAVLKKASNDPAAKAFEQYLLSEQGQELWAKQGYRPVIASAAAAAGVSFPQPKQLFTIESLGGWPSVTDKFFATPGGIITRIEQSLGVSTASS